MAKDFLGNEIHVDDWVLFVQLNYRNLKIGKVDHITEQMVFIEYKKTYDKITWDSDVVRQEFRQVVALEDSKVPQYIKDRFLKEVKND